MFALDLLNQFQSYNGTLLAAGKIYVYNLGRTHLATVYGDHNGATPIANPVILDDQGMAEIYLNDAFNYTIVVYDAYGQEQFSRDIYPRGMGNGESIGTQLYEGIDPIVVNNDVYAISANTTKLGVQDPLYFVQDDEERVIIGFSGQTDIPGIMNESAFGYEDGQITSYNGSAFSAGNTYEAGSYIDIDGNTISVTGLSPVPADTASTGLVASVSADITAMIPDTSDMATKTWVDEQGFLTAHQDISNKLDTTAFSTVSGDFITAIPDNYATKDYVSSSVSSKLDSTAFSTVSSNFLTAVPEEYATESWVTSQGYLTAVPDDMATTGFVADVSADITAMIPTALTGEYLDKASADTLYYPLNQNPSGYLTAETDWTNTITAASANAYEQATAAIPAPFDPTYLSGQIDNKLDSAIYANDSATFLTALPSDLVYTADIQDMATTGDLQTISGEITGMIPSTAGLASEDWVTAQGYITNDAITGKQDITGMTAYQAAGDYLSANALDNLSGNWETVTAKLDTTAFSDVSGTFLTAHQDLSDYQLTADMTAYQPVGDYLTATALDNVSGDWNEVSAKLDTTAFSDVSGTFLTAHQDLSDYQTTAGMTAYQEAGDYYSASNPSGFITGVDLTPYQTTAEMTAYQELLEFSYDSANYISAINNSAISTTPGRDLYVREPLYTGMTGDSAYIGVYESAIQPLVFGYTAIGE